ncbi:MAG: helix-turn-helix domain-containing protein, partial [Ktedonobacterales bacterium]
MSTHTSDPDSLDTVGGPREIYSVDEVRQPQGTFGALMRELRDRNGLSQDELAKLLAQSTSYVSLLETGRRKPTRRVVSNLCSALALSEEDEAKLTAAAGFPVDQLGRAIEYVVDLVMAAAPGEDLERETVRADLTASADT